MAIIIVQTCDDCGASRDLSVEDVLMGERLQKLSNDKGWVEVRPNKHICSKCIDAHIKR